MFKQFIGKLDYKGQALHEGDIIKHPNQEETGTIIYDLLLSQFRVLYSNGTYLAVGMQVGENGKAVKIGSVYDNPQLEREHNIDKLRQFLIQNPYFNLSGICIKLGFQKQLLMNFVSKGYGLGEKLQEDKVFEFFRNFGYNDTEKANTTIETVDDILSNIAYFILQKPLFDFAVGTQVQINKSDGNRYLYIHHKNNSNLSFSLPIEFGLNSEWFKPITWKEHREIFKENSMMYFMQEYNNTREEAEEFWIFFEDHHKKSKL